MGLARREARGSKYDIGDEVRIVGGGGLGLVRLRGVSSVMCTGSDGGDDDAGRYWWPSVNKQRSGEQNQREREREPAAEIKKNQKKSHFVQSNYLKFKQSPLSTRK